MSEVVSEVMSESEPVSEVFGHVHVRSRVRVRSHGFARVRVRVRVRGPKKSRVRVRVRFGHGLGHELMSELVSVSVHLCLRARAQTVDQHGMKG